MADDSDERAQETQEAADYHPALDLVVPMVMLVTSVAYAWSLRNIADPELNLLFLKPIFAIIWVFLLLVGVSYVIPTLRLLAAGTRKTGVPAVPLRRRFGPGTEGGAGLVVIATFVYALVALNGTEVFIASTCIYLMLSAWLIGERRPLPILAQGLLGTGGIYLVMGVLLGVKF